MRVADDRAGGKAPALQPARIRTALPRCEPAARGPQLVMPAKAGIHLGVHGNSDPKSGDKPPATRPYEVSPALQQCPGSVARGSVKSGPQSLNLCHKYIALCKPALRQAQSLPRTRYSVSTRYGGERNRQESVRVSAECCAKPLSKHESAIESIYETATIQSRYHPVGRRSDGGRG